MPSSRRLAFALQFFGLLAVVSVASVAFAALRLQQGQAKPQPKRLLVVTVTKGFRHEESIPVAEKLVAQMGAKSGAFTVDYVRTDADMQAKMTVQALQKVDGVMFVSTTGDLPLPDRDGFLNWIREGHAFIGVHAASDTFHNFKPYLDMVGGEFKTHGAQSWVVANVEDKNHPATRHLGKSRLVFDEIYQFQNYDRARFQGLLSLDKHPNNQTPGDYPIAWCRNEGKGRVFYTALGHRADVWASGWYQTHVLGGIQWALGQKTGVEKLTQT
jgi:hypothetical protein